MKLRNKQTGEIVDFKMHKYVGLSDDGNSVYEPFNGSIEEWEDASKEPKEYWYVDCDGEIVCCESGILIGERTMISIGNHFETRGEAVKAIEKLEAWERLKDKGFRFTNWEFSDVLDGALVIEAGLNFDNDSNIQRDLEICFGGEE